MTGVWIGCGMFLTVLGVAVVSDVVRMANRMTAARRRRHSRVPAFRFGSGPLAGVGLDTRRPWVKR